MRYFLDTEYNGHRGALISLALVSEHGDEELYLRLPLPEPLDPWVARNVVPYLGSVPVGLVAGETSERDAADGIAHYLAGDDDVHIVADWPDDISYFCQLIVTGPAEIAELNHLRFEFIRTPGFSTARNSKVPHNALHDARALRDFVLGWES